MLVVVGGAGFADVGRSFSTVPIATPAMRQVARTLLPSTSIERTWARFSVLSRFIRLTASKKSRWELE